MTKEGASQQREEGKSTGNLTLEEDFPERGGTRVWAKPEGRLTHTPSLFIENHLADPIYRLALQQCTFLSRKVKVGHEFINAMNVHATCSLLGRAIITFHCLLQLSVLRYITI